MIMIIILTTTTTNKHNIIMIIVLLIALLIIIVIKNMIRDTGVLVPLGCARLSRWGAKKHVGDASARKYSNRGSMRRRGLHQEARAASMTQYDFSAHRKKALAFDSSFARTARSR